MSSTKSRGRRGAIGVVGLLGVLGVWLGLRDKTATPSAPKPDAPDDPDDPDDPDPDAPDPDAPTVPVWPVVPVWPAEPTPEQPTPEQPTPEQPTPGQPTPEQPTPGQRPGRRPRPPGLGELTLEYPGGGGFWQVRKGDRWGGTDSKGIAYRYLLNEGYAAATQHGGLGHEAAIAWARQLARNAARRLQVIDLVQGSGWNDLFYGALPQAGTRATPGTGRSILLLPQHAPVAQQIALRQQPQRNARLGNGQGVDPTLRSYEFVWLPGIDRERLWTSGGAELSTVGQWWPDGSTKENPPGWIRALGVDDLSGATDTITTWGSPDGDGQIEVG